MASLNLAPEELKQLELMRNRFHQLSSTLDTLMRDMYHSDPLPSGYVIFFTFLSLLPPSFLSSQIRLHPERIKAQTAANHTDS